MTDRELMQMALDALEYDTSPDPQYGIRAAINILSDRLAQPELEPFAYYYEQGGQLLWSLPPLTDEEKTLDLKPLYTAPPKREWVGLTDEEAWKCWDWEDFQGTWKSMESKLKEKNT